MFNPSTCTSTSVLHNLVPEDRAYIRERIQDPILHPLSIHPIFVPTLIAELLFREALQLLDTVHVKSVRLYIIANLVADDRYENDEMRKHPPTAEEQSDETSLRYEQRAIILQEKMESAIRLASTLLKWIPDFDTPRSSPDL